MAFLVQETNDHSFLSRRSAREDVHVSNLLASLRKEDNQGQNVTVDAELVGFTQGGDFCSTFGGFNYFFVEVLPLNSVFLFGLCCEERAPIAEG